MVAEKNRDCLVFGQDRQEFFYIVDKSHIQHAVGFV